MVTQRYFLRAKNVSVCAAVLVKDALQKLGDRSVGLRTHSLKENKFLNENDDKQTCGIDARGKRRRRPSDRRMRPTATRSSRASPHPMREPTWGKLATRYMDYGK